MKKVIIIGAGPAGLTAAQELQKSGDEYDITILEASGDIGGISKTVRHGGSRMDIGGHRFFSKSKEIMDRWAELMPLQGSPSYDDKLLDRPRPMTAGGPDPEKDDQVMLMRHRVSRIYYLKKFFDYPISMKAQTLKNMGFGRTMKIGFSYMKSVVLKKPENNLENFYINRFGKILYGMFFEGYTEKLWGRHPSEISADWGAQRVKGISVSALIRDILKKAAGKKDNANAETSLIEEFWYPKYGPGQLWEALAKTVEQNGAKILMHHEVCSLTKEGGSITVVGCKTPDGTAELKADIVISTMPLKDLVAGLGGSAPQNISRIAGGLPYRDFVTVGLKLKKLDLKNETTMKTLGNIVPDCWIYVQETDVKLGRIQIFNNWSPYMVEDPQNNIWIGLEYFCAEGDDFWNMSDDETVRKAAGELEHMGLIKKDYILDSHCERIKKAYPAYFDTYSEIDTLTDYLDSIDNLYCIGRNGQHRYNNMDHSMLTAIAAVNCIKTGASKAAVWQVNTEQDYHEGKKDEA